MARFHDLTLRDVHPEGGDGVALVFDLPDALAGQFGFQPGQYLTLSATLDGEELRRNYSIAALPGGALSVAVREVPGGRFSPYAVALKPGDQVRVAPPQGRFVYRGEREVLLIAAGSGITPMISIAGAALASGAEVTLVYGNRGVGSIMFRTLLDDFKDKYMTRFRLVHILSREAQDVPLLEGRIDGEKLSRLAQAGVISPAADGIFLCGPGEMIDTLRPALEALGADPARIHAERFTPASGAPRPVSQAAEAAAARGVSVEAILDGARRAFRLEEGDESLVTAAARVGVDLPWSCKGGMCSTCRCRVVEGSAEMAVNWALEPWEVAAGFTLACQARPTSDRLVLDFDAV